MKLLFIIQKLLLLPLQVNIDKKLADAPDDKYQIGIVIGTYLPLIVLFALAYWMYYRAKNKKDFDD